jgi:type IV secretion system protein VirB11
VPALDRDRLEAVAILAARMTFKSVSYLQPSCVSMLPDGQRIKIMLPPAVPSGTVSLCIRRRALSFTPTLKWLAETDYFELLDSGIDWLAYFTRAVHGTAIQKPRPIIISGEVGSSKTTFAEALVRAIPLDQRVVTLEGSPEWISLPHPNWQALFFDEADPTSATRRVQDAMQSRPDWVPFQELRGAEAWAYMRALKAGFRGITTAHAGDARAVLRAIASMIRQAPEGQTQHEADIIADLRLYLGLIVHVVRIMPEHDGEASRYRAVEVLEIGQTETEDIIVSCSR